MKPTLFSSTATKSARPDSEVRAKGRILGRFPGVRPPKNDCSEGGEIGLVPATGCLFAEGRWALALAATSSRCVSQNAGGTAGAQKSLDDLPGLVRRRLLALGASARPREVVIGADLDPLFLNERPLDAVLQAAEILVTAGVRIRLSTRGAPHPDTPFGRLLIRAAANAGAALEIGLIAMDGDIARAYEPGAPSPGERLLAARRLGAMGVVVEGRLGPMLPWISDTTAHLEAVVEAFRGAGISLVRASYFQLDVEGARRIRKLRPAHRALLKGCFRGEPRHANEAHLLPRELRAKGYSRLDRLAARAKIAIVVCEETNPDVRFAKPCFSVTAPRRVPRPRAGVGAAKGGAPRPSRVLAAGLFDPTGSESGALPRANPWRRQRGRRSEAQLDLFARS